VLLAFDDLLQLSDALLPFLHFLLQIVLAHQKAAPTTINWLNFNDFDQLASPVVGMFQLYPIVHIQLNVFLQKLLVFLLASFQSQL
jgi:hypothetical protein